jgi:hypothetical protein
MIRSISSRGIIPAFFVPRSRTEVGSSQSGRIRQNLPKMADFGQPFGLTIF